MVGAEGSTELMAHLTTGAVTVYGIEWLKGQAWCTWIHADSKTLNRVLSAAAAGVIALGVTWTGDANHGWVIQIPAVAVLMAGLWEWVKQAVLQQILFDGIVQKAGAAVQKGS